MSEENTENTEEIVEEAATAATVAIEETAEVDEATEPTEATEDEEVVEEVVRPAKVSVFITEQDSFDITVEYIRQETDISVKGLDEDFDEDADNIESFSCTFKYPSQHDCNVISGSLVISGDEDMSMQQLRYLEQIRIINLIRSWSFAVDCESDNIMAMEPNLIKGIAVELRKVIGVKGVV